MSISWGGTWTLLQRYTTVSCLFLFCFCILSLPKCFCLLELREGQGGWMKPISSNEEMVGGGTSLAVQWLRFCASTARAMGLIPGPWTKILHTLWQVQKENRRQRKGFGAQKSPKVLLRFRTLFGNKDFCVCIHDKHWILVFFPLLFIFLVLIILNTSLIKWIENCFLLLHYLEEIVWNWCCFSFKYLV